MRIEAASRGDVHYVALNMRERDYAEFSAVSMTDDRRELAENLAERFAEGAICCLDGTHPVCIGATIEARPNVATLLFFATDDFPRAALRVTRFIVRELFPRLKASGIHRIEAVSMDGHSTAHAWLETIGLQRETGPMFGYGKNRETFIQFAWSDDVRSAGA